MIGKLIAPVAALAVANVLNNRVAPRWAPLTSAATTGLLLALGRRSGLSWGEMGFERPRQGALAGGALAAAVAAVYTAGVAYPHTRPLFHDERALRLSRARLLEEVLLQVPVGTVLLEEVGFRGVVYGLVRHSHGAGTATAVSSALFGLWHVLPSFDLAKANPALAKSGMVPLVAGSVVSTGVAGAFFCELRRRRGLVAPALLHTATNSLGFLAARVAARLKR